MLKSIKTLFGIHSNELVRKLKKPIPTLRYACKQAYNQGLDAWKKAKSLEAKLDDLPEGETKDRLTKIVKDLKARAKELKKKYNEWEGRIEEFEARIAMAKLEYELISEAAGHDDSPLQLMKEVEAEVERIERDVKAMMEYEKL